MAEALTPEQRAMLAVLGRMGGKTRASRMSKSARKAAASRAAKVRWKNHVPKAKKLHDASKVGAKRTKLRERAKKSS